MRCWANRYITRLAALLLAVLFCVLACAHVSAEGEIEQPSCAEASAVYLYNLENGKPLIEKNTDAAITPASTVKIMTGLLVLEHFSGRLDEEISVSARDIDGVVGNMLSLKAGEVYTVRQLLYSVICGGHNDSAQVLASAVSGSVESFVALMNKRAAEWGMTSTHYTNPTGIKSSTMKTTAADVAILAHRAYENETFVTMSSETRYEIPADSNSPARTVTNRNALLYGRETEYRNLSCIGLNAGADSGSNYCVVTVAKRDGLSYLCVVMGASSTEDATYSYIVANRIIKWAFETYGYVKVIDSENYSLEVPVELSDSIASVKVVPREDASAFLPKVAASGGLTYITSFYRESVRAPFAEGDAVGYLIVKYAGEEVSRVELITTESAEASAFLLAIENLRDLTSNRVLLLSLGFALLLGTAAAIVLTLLAKRQRAKRRRYRIRK